MPAADDWIQRRRPPRATPSQSIGTLAWPQKISAVKISRATRSWPASTISACGAAAAICSKWRGFVT
jgi:hypothetical protein